MLALPAAALSFLASGEPAFADLRLCNRMSYVVEAAIGIDDKAATATRGWFRIDPATCRVVVQGTRTPHAEERRSAAIRTRAAKSARCDASRSMGRPSGRPP